VTTNPSSEKHPTMLVNSPQVDFSKFLSKRLKLLNENLRLDHIKEGSNEIRKICEEYVDIFKLPGDALTATNAVQLTIPTPTITKGRAITLRNYRLPESQQQEIKTKYLRC
jgi:hypothetical protein